MFLCSFCSFQLVGFTARRDDLLRLTKGTAYETQKSRLVIDFVAFLESNSSLPSLDRTASSALLASPEDVVKFLFFRDARGKTQVHRLECGNLGLAGRFSCGCPLRLAAGTVDSIVGKLRAFSTVWGVRMNMCLVTLPAILALLRWSGIG